MMKEGGVARKSTLGPSLCGFLASRLHFLQSLLHHLELIAAF